MKTTLVVLIVLCAVAAFGQTASVLPNQPQIVQVPDHPQHAEPHALATERSIVGGGPETYTYARGERPLWEFGSPLPQPKPLGDIARAFRQEKLTSKKAEIVLEQQGSASASRR